MSRGSEFESTLEFQRIFSLCCELDGDDAQRVEVTNACVEALFDRLLNPPILEEKFPTMADVDSSERAAIGLIQLEAKKVRELIRGAAGNSGSAQPFYGVNVRSSRPGA